MAKILVTGGTGFLGSYLLYYLTNNNEKPIAIKRKNSSFKTIKNIFISQGDSNLELFKNIEWKEIDILDYYNIGEAMKGIDIIFHSAAMVSFNSKNKEKILETNYYATKNLINFSLINNVSKFCYVSSVATLSKDINQEIFNEESWFSWSDRKSNYAISKYLAETEVWRGFAEGLNGFIINPSLIIGPGDNNGLFPNLIKKLKNKSLFFPRGSSGFVDVRDVAQIILKLEKLNVKHERYIINAYNKSFKEVISFFSKKFNSREPSIPINRGLIKIYLLFSIIYNFILNKKTLISTEMLEFIDGKLNYCNKKIKRKLDYKFIKFEKSLEDTLKEK